MKRTSLKNIFQMAVLIAVSVVSTAHASKYYGIMDRLKSPTVNLEDVRKKAEAYEERMLACSKSNPAEECNQATTTNTVLLGVDGASQPIYLAYISYGHPKINKGTIICACDLFGSGGYNKLALLWAAQGYYVVAFDGLGVGASSYNDPVAMDDFNGYSGYSYQQLASLFHQAIINLGVSPNSATKPITYVGCDFYAAVGLVYAYQYQDDPYGLSFFVSDNGSFGNVLSTSPCSLNILTPETAEYVAGLYAGDPCGILCALNSGAFNQPGLPGDFTEINCPDWGNYALNLSVNYGSTMPPSVFARQLTQSLAFDTSALFAQINVPMFLINGGIFQLPVNKQTGLLPLYGMCYGCQPGCNCANPTYYQPSPNSIGRLYQNAGICCHASRTSTFYNDVLGFISGTAGACDPYWLIPISASNNCPPNPSCTSNP